MSGILIDFKIIISQIEKPNFFYVILLSGDSMEKLNMLIEQLRKKVDSYFKQDVTGHNIDHLERTLKYALYLQSKEGGDAIVIGISAFIHDIHRILGAKLNRFVPPKESLSVVEEFINDLDISKTQKEHILFAIEHHEEYGFGKEKTSVSDIESLILQDADNLDATGAMGIVRSFKYGIAHNMKDYDPTVDLYRNDFSEGQNDASTIHHIYNKLLRLGDYMNTKTARELAYKKTKLMEQFLNLYIEEFNGDF